MWQSVVEIYSNSLHVQVQDAEDESFHSGSTELVGSF